MSWLKKICLVMAVASSLLFVVPSTAEAARYGYRGRAYYGGYANRYYGPNRYYGGYARPSYGWYGRSYYRPYVYRNYYAPRAYIASPRVRVVW
jgi:hypothetical protein